MKFKFSFLLLVIVTFASKTIGQSQKSLKEYTLTSTYQIDKITNGNVVKSNQKVTIYLQDPLPLTNDSTDFIYRPSGQLNIKYEGLEEIKNEIKYLGKFDFGDATNQSLYSIVGSQTGGISVIHEYTAFVFVKKKMTINGQIFNHIVFMGKFGLEGGMPEVFTMFCCN